MSNITSRRGQSAKFLKPPPWSLYLALLILQLGALSPLKVEGKHTILVKIGIINNPPKFIVSSQGEVSGFWSEILDYIAEEEGWKIKYVICDFDKCLDLLKKNKIDILPDVAFTEERAREFEFNKEPLFVNWGTIYTRKDLKFFSILDLDGMKVVAMKNSVHTEALKKLLKEFNIACQLIEVEDYLEVFKALSSGKADAGVVNRLFGHMFEKKFNVSKTPIVFNPVEVKCAFPKNSPRNKYLINTIDSYVRKLKEDENSIYYSAIDEYFGGEKRIVIQVEPINKLFRLLLALVLTVFILRKRRTISTLPGYRLLIHSFYIFFIAWFLTNLMYFKYSLFLHITEHIFYSIGAIILAIWWTKWALKKEDRSV